MLWLKTHYHAQLGQTKVVQSKRWLFIGSKNHTKGTIGYDIPQGNTWWCFPSSRLSAICIHGKVIIMSLHLTTTNLKVVYLSLQACLRRYVWLCSKTTLIFLDYIFLDIPTLTLAVVFLGILLLLVYIHNIHVFG